MGPQLPRAAPSPCHRFQTSGSLLLVTMTLRSKLFNPEKISLIPRIDLQQVTPR